jgi:prolipoprotein diacylglyceryltransferase
LLAALAGARLFYAGENWSYFSTHLIETPQLWLGGLAWPGAILGAWLMMIYISLANRAQRRTLLTQRIPFGLLGDRVYPMLPPLAITTWLGCWQVGAYYGAALPAGSWWGIPGLDETGAVGLRFPLQPVMALALLVFFWLLETRVKPLQPTGRLSALAMIGLLLDLLAASLLTASPSPTWNGLRLDTWFAILCLGLFTAFVAINNLVTHSPRKQIPSIL